MAVGWRGTAALVAVSVSAASPASAAICGLDPFGSARDVALVIGNGGYEGPAALPNARADAELVAQSLAGAGFHVELALDQPQAKIDSIVTRIGFACAMDRVVLYYAGHGYTLDGIVYALPVDAELGEGEPTPEVFQSAGVALNEIAARLVKAARPDLLVLFDATADERGGQPTDAAGGPGAAAAQFAEIPSLGAVVFSGEIGGTVLDSIGSGDAHGPFATALAETLQTSGSGDLDAILPMIRARVTELSDGRQRPVWYRNPAVAEFRFARPATINRVGADPAR